MHKIWGLLISTGDLMWFAFRCPTHVIPSFYSLFPIIHPFRLFVSLHLWSLGCNWWTNGWPPPVVATSVAEDGIFQRLAQSMAANPEARACLEADGLDGFVLNVLLRFCRPWNLKLRTNNLYATSNDYSGAYDYVRALGEGLKCYPE